MFDPFSISVKMDRSLHFLVISFSSFAFHVRVSLLPAFLFFGFGAICSVMIEAVANTIWLISVSNFNNSLVGSSDCLATTAISFIFSG